MYNRGSFQSRKTLFWTNAASTLFDRTTPSRLRRPNLCQVRATSRGEAVACRNWFEAETTRLNPHTSGSERHLLPLHRSVYLQAIT